MHFIHLRPPVQPRGSQAKTQHVANEERERSRRKGTCAACLESLEVCSIINPVQTRMYCKYSGRTTRNLRFLIEGHLFRTSQLQKVIEIRMLNPGARVLRCTIVQGGSSSQQQTLSLDQSGMIASLDLNRVYVADHLNHQPPCSAAAHRSYAERTVAVV